MENKTSLDLELDAGVPRCSELATMITELTASITADRASADRSIAAKAQRALANADFEQTTPRRSRELAAKQVAMAIKSGRTALEKGIAAAVDITLAQARLHALENAEAARKAEMADKDGSIPREARRFYLEMTDRGVSASMWDILNKGELDVVAELFLQKKVDYRHKVPWGAWTALFLGGYTGFPVEGLPEDATLAVRATSVDAEGLIAKRYIEEVAGRVVDISPGFALALVKSKRVKIKSRGLRLTHERISADDVDDDLRFILDTLGLDEQDCGHADAILSRVYAPKMAEFEQRRVEEAAAHEKLVELYLPVARKVRTRRAEQREKFRDRQRVQERSDGSEVDAADDLVSTSGFEGISDPVQAEDTGPAVDPTSAVTGDDSAEPVPMCESANTTVPTDRPSYTDGPASSAASTELSGNTKARSGAPSELGTVGSADPGRDRAVEADRQMYRAAIARDENWQDRQVAGWIATSEHYRTRLRRMGFDVPEAPLDPGEDITPDHQVSADNNTDEPVSADDNAPAPLASGDVDATDQQAYSGDDPVGPQVLDAAASSSSLPNIRRSSMEGRTRSELSKIMRGE